ncbi:MAG: putative oxidoreductase [Actinomycetia bacterium]|nr:putative oxidoreductase [Actinomycetes bacterium]
MPSDMQLLKENLAVVEPVQDKAVGYFYATLFRRNPEVRSMFPLVMDVQRDRLFRALTSAVQGMDRPESLVPMLRQLARDHRKFGVRPEHYEVVGRALIGAVRQYSYGDWSEEIEAAWWRAFTMIARTMIDAAAEVEHEPATWQAEIVSHQRRTLDIAVLRLRPDAPYPFEAGQYTTVESPWLPRVWRSYSMANAPRPGNEIELHVRRIGAGWVSGALLRKHQAGDVLRLGPPRGDTVLDRDSPRDLLCVAGSTGLAPMKAIIEDLGRSNTTRRAHLFFGARLEEDLYDLDGLDDLAARHPWLTVIPTVSHDPGYPGEQGNAAEVAARRGAWQHHDVYVSGSPAMITAATALFRELQVPAGRIRYDSFGDTGIVRGF